VSVRSNSSNASSSQPTCSTEEHLNMEEDQEIDPYNVS